MARRRQRRGLPVDGILLLDKPIGISSNAALQQAKRLYFAQKAGHTGSLDPLASGMLPVCFGEATKFSQYLLDSDKRYRVTAQLGERTETGDADGEVIQTREVNVTEQQILQALPQFRGEIDQVPSMYSALKHQGQPLYKLARQGIEVERPARRITIYELELLAFNGSQMQMEVSCSKGTYIRSLMEDLGEVLGCGAHVAELRRLSVAHFPADRMITLEELQEIKQDDGPQALDALLLPITEALQGWPAVDLSADATFYLRQGQPVMVPQAPTEGWVQLLDHDKRFVGVGEILDDGRVAPRRLLAEADHSV